ncbi:MAG: flavodoxin family protein [Firmicutes bacterium]|nr:flavodoxin family protein [Bacillota bacterium]
MKTAIVYYSRHHGNTKKLIDAIAARWEVTVIDASEVKTADLSQFDAVGLASGIYYSKFHETVLTFAEKNLPEGKNVFFLYTCGSKRKGYTQTIADCVNRHSATVLGEYGCPGFDTFGPFKLIGGIAKGHPDSHDLDGAVAFYEKAVLRENTDTCE